MNEIMVTEKKIHKVLMIAPSFPRGGGAESFVNGKLALAFINAGWKVDIISMSDNGKPFKEDSSSIWNPLEGNTYSVDSGKSWLDYRLKMLIWACNAYCLASKLMKKKQYHVVMSRCQPIWSHLPAMLLNKTTGIKWIANWNDPSPIRRYPKPYGQGPNAHIPFLLEYMFRKICLQASWHTFPSERLLKYMHQYMPKEVHSKSSVVSHIALKKSVEEKFKNKFLIISHTGSIYFRNWEHFLNGVKKFISNEDNINIRINFLGWQPHEFIERVQKLNLGNIISVKQALPYEDSLKFMEDANVLLVIEADSEEGIFFPSKFADYIQVGRPILAISPRQGTLSDLIQRYGGGLNADCTSPDDIANALKIIYKSWQEDALNSNFSIKELHKIVSEENVISLYENIFKKIF